MYLKFNVQYDPLWSTPRSIDLLCTFICPLVLEFRHWKTMFNFATFVRYLAICGFCGCRILLISEGLRESLSLHLQHWWLSRPPWWGLLLYRLPWPQSYAAVQRVRKRESPTQEVIESHCLISGIVFWCFLRAFFHKVDMIIPFLAISQLCVAVSFQGARWGIESSQIPKVSKLWQTWITVHSC